MELLRRITLRSLEFTVVGVGSFDKPLSSESAEGLTHLLLDVTVVCHLSD
jgi:hypothetical protein